MPSFVVFQLFPSFKVISLAVEDTVNNVDVDGGHIDGHAGHVYHGYIDTHEDSHTWSNLVSRGTFVGKHMRNCTA